MNYRLSTRSSSSHQPDCSNLLANKPCDWLDGSCHKTDVLYAALASDKRIERCAIWLFNSYHFLWICHWMGLTESFSACLLLTNASSHLQAWNYSTYLHEKLWKMRSFQIFSCKCLSKTFTLPLFNEMWCWTLVVYTRCCKRITVFYCIFMLQFF